MNWTLDSSESVFHLDKILNPFWENYDTTTKQFKSEFIPPSSFIYPIWTGLTNIGWYNAGWNVIQTGIITWLIVKVHYILKFMPLIGPVTSASNLTTPVYCHIHLYLELLLVFSSLAILIYLICKLFLHYNHGLTVNLQNLRNRITSYRSSGNEQAIHAQGPICLNNSQPFVNDFSLSFRGPVTAIPAGGPRYTEVDTTPAAHYAVPRKDLLDTPNSPKQRDRPKTKGPTVL